MYRKRVVLVVFGEYRRSNMGLLVFFGTSNGDITSGAKKRKEKRCRESVLGLESAEVPRRQTLHPDRSSCGSRSRQGARSTPLSRQINKWRPKI